MIGFDFICENKECKKHEHRVSRLYPNKRYKDEYPPKCWECQSLLKEVPLLPKEHAPGRLVIKGATTVNTNEGFARGLTSKNPEDLKRDLKNGDLFN